MTLLLVATISCQPSPFSAAPAPRSEAPVYWAGLGPISLSRDCDTPSPETLAPLLEYRVARLQRAEESAAGCVKDRELAQPCMTGRVILSGTLHSGVLRAGKPAHNTTGSEWLAGCLGRSASKLRFGEGLSEVDVAYSVSERKFLNVFE